MKEYTLKQIKELKSNPYTFNVTKYNLYFTSKFKKDFWIRYQAGDFPRKILRDFGYNLDYFGQKQIELYKKRKEALSGNGFSEGESHEKRVSIKAAPDAELISSPSIERMQNELLYLRQNVKKIRRLMKKYGLVCGIRKAKPYRRMSKAIKTNHVADNLVKREFEKYGPRMILLTDIT